MSNTQHLNSPPAPPRASARTQPPGASAGSGSSLDPLKMLVKYKFVLIGAMIAGTFIGVASHFFFLRFFPGFESTVLFQCSPVDIDIESISTATIDDDEMAMFMGTEVKRITGEQVLTSVLNDARLASESPLWFKRYSKGGILNFVDAYEELEEIIRSFVIPNTYYIQLSVQVRDPNDAAGLVRLVKENYLRLLESGTNTGVTKRKEAIRKAIVEVGDTIKELNNRRNRLIAESGSEANSVENSAQAEMLRYVNAQIINAEQQVEAINVMLAKDESQLQRETGIQYDSTLREVVELYPLIQGLKQQITTLEIQLLALQTDGIQPLHRSYQLLLQNIDASERLLDQRRDELLLESFETRIDSTRMALSQFRAQIADLLSKQETLEAEINDLTQATEEIEDITRQIENAQMLEAEHQSNFAQLSMAARLDTAGRVVVSKSENVPDRPSFPILKVMIPAGIFLITALTAGGLVIFEMLDQRIKSAADIAMIPRTRILGIIPDADEDPASHSSIETLFMDSPNSVLAEHYRQLRTKICKNMDAHGHKTILVAGAMPGSGATSVATNLAQACIASGKKTLLIDTNFRRAKVHTAFGLLESPGLAEALAGDKSIGECIQKTTSTGPDVLSAGAVKMRVVERLGTQDMGKVLAEVSAMYDMVILDVAPAIVAGDAITLANQVDATMLVVRAMSEKRGQVARLKNELGDSRAELLGVLVNGVRSSAGGYMRKNIRTSHLYHTSESENAA